MNSRRLIVRPSKPQRPSRPGRCPPNEPSPEYAMHGSLMLGARQVLGLDLNCSEIAQGGPIVQSPRENMTARDPPMRSIGCGACAVGPCGDRPRPPDCI